MNYIIIVSILVNLIFGADNYNLELLSIIDADEQNSSLNYGVSDVWGYTDETGIEYAIVGYRYGTYIYDVSSDINNPQLVMDILGPSGNDIYFHRDYKTNGDFLYIVNEMTGDDIGMQVIDLSPLPENEPIKLDTYDALQQSHNLWIDDFNQLAFVENTYPQNIKILDISNPENIFEVGTFYGNHGINCHDIFSRGDFAYISEGWSSQFTIYDISEISNPISLVTIPVLGYAHNAWLNDAGTHLITTEETDLMTIKIWDIESLENINLVGEYLGENNLAHNVHVLNDQLIISHYTTGIKIVDIFNPSKPVEVAAFDTYIQNDNGGYYGCWGAYPFTQNNMIFASDMQNGLFILDYETKYASWRTGYLYDHIGQILTDTEIKSTLNNKSFFTDDYGYFDIGFPDGEYEFDVFQDGILLDSITMVFLEHEEINESIYLGLDDIIYGDLNNDGVINVLDVVNMTNIVLSNIQPNPYMSLVSDLNNDELINVLDIILVVNIIISS